MDNSIIKAQTTDLATTETLPVRLTGGQVHLPLKIFSQLPNILKLEIEHPLFKDSGKQIDVLNKIVRMLGVQFKDEADKKASGGEWVAFCQNFRLTAPEIVEAYTMVLKKELKIFDEEKAFRNSEYEGEFIKVYPNLSLITAGEILNAYIEFKRLDKKLESGRKRISEYLNPEPVISEEEKKETKLKLWENLKSEVSENKPCNHAFLFYDSLVKKGNFKNFLSNKEAQSIVLGKKMKEVIVREYRNPVIFGKHEAKRNYDSMMRGEEIQVHNIAIIEVKNDLVYNFVKKQIKKNAKTTDIL